MIRYWCRCCKSTGCRACYLTRWASWQNKLGWQLARVLPLSGMYVPPLLRLWDEVAPENSLFNRLDSRTVVCGLNCDPWAMKSFKMAISIREACIFIITYKDNLNSIDEDMTNSIIFAVDWLTSLGRDWNQTLWHWQTGVRTLPSVLQGVAVHFFSGARRGTFALLIDIAFPVKGCATRSFSGWDYMM